MATSTTDRPSAAELRAEKAARVAAEQAKLDEAHERVKSEGDGPGSDSSTSNEAPAGSANATGRGSNVDAQDGLFDQLVENAELEAALEDREKRNNSRLELTRQFKEADTKAKGILATLVDIEEGTVVRVGPFRIEKSPVKAKSVAFETGPTSKLSITRADD